MFKSLTPLFKISEVSLRRGLSNAPCSYFFATSQDYFIQRVQAEPKPKFVMPPQREPMPVGEEQEYMQMPNEEYLELIGEKTSTLKRSAYASVERRGKVYHLYDAERIPVGRMCQSIARFIQGKHTPIYRHDKAGFGDVCVIVNVDKLKFTGKKAFTKSIKYHTGYVGHLKEIPYKRMILEKPEQLVFRIISKMLPKNKLREEYLKLIHCFRGPTHTLTKFLPNFGNIYEDYTELQNKVSQKPTPEDSVVIYETAPGTADEFKDIKREIDYSVEIPLKDRSTRTTMTSKNKQIYKEYQKHLKKLRRFKEYKIKKPRVSDIVEQAKHGSVFIDRDWKYRKLNLAELEKNDEPDDD